LPRSLWRTCSSGRATRRLYTRFFGDRANVGSFFLRCSLDWFCDQPYYNHGARYWNGGYEMIWVRGHMSRCGNHWIHGQYVRVRREHRQHDWNGRNDDRYDRLPPINWATSNFAARA
jgi:hypothetical protein